MAAQVFLTIIAQGLSKADILPMLADVLGNRVLIVYVVEGKLFTSYQTLQIVVSNNHHFFLTNVLNALFDRVSAKSSDVLSMSIHNLQRSDDYEANTNALLRLHKEKTGSYQGAMYVSSPDGKFEAFPVSEDHRAHHGGNAEVLVMTDAGMIFR